MEPLARGHVERTDTATARGGDGLERATHDAVNQAEWRDLVDQQPQEQGVQELGDDAVNIRVVAWVDAGARRRFERHLRRRPKE